MNVKFQIYLLYRNHKTFYKKEKNNVDKDLHFFTVKHSYALYIAKWCNNVLIFFESIVFFVEYY